MKTEFGQKRKNNKKQTMAILMAGAYCFGRFLRPINRQTELRRL